MKRILALHLAILLILAACSASAPARDVETTLVTITPSMLPTDTPVPTPESTTTPVPTAQFQSFPKIRCCDGKPIEAGEFQLPSWLGIPLTLGVKEGWRVLNEERALLFLLGKGHNSFNDPTQVLVFIVVPDENPQSILTAIRDSPELVPAGEIKEAEIAGFSGLQLDVSAKPNPAYKGNPSGEIPPGVQFLPAVNKYFAPGFMWTTWTAETQLRFIALNVGEHLLLLQIESPPAEFEAFASEVNHVLQTLKLWR